jgi:hypothetical protein
MFRGGDEPASGVDMSSDQELRSVALLGIVAFLSTAYVVFSLGRAFKLIYRGAGEDPIRSAPAFVGYLSTAYVMIAAFYASIYLLIFKLDTTSFSFDGPKGLHLNSVIALYFSIATITTTGYGDIHPNSEWAMTVASLEMLTGQLMNIVFFSVIAGLAFRVRSTSSET